MCDGYLYSPSINGLLQKAVGLGFSWLTRLVDVDISSPRLACVDTSVAEPCLQKVKILVMLKRPSLASCFILP